MKIAVYGANGRMGQQLLKAAQSAGAQVVSATRDEPNFSELANCDVVIDFSSPSASKSLLEQLLALQNSAAKLPALLVGTTGLDDEYFTLSKRYLGVYFYSSNTSLGVAALCELARLCAGLLSDFDVEICEHHHRYKKDAPSGTALSLARAVSKVRGANVQLARSGERAAGEIGLAATRGGDVAGRHVVGFYGDGEWLELQHYANDRAIFAKGAVSIAAWLVRQKPGSYEMRDFVAANVAEALARCNER